MRLLEFLKKIGDLYLFRKKYYVSEMCTLIYTDKYLNLIRVIKFDMNQDISNYVDVTIMDNIPIDGLFDILKNEPNLRNLRLEVKLYQDSL